MMFSVRPWNIWPMLAVSYLKEQALSGWLVVFIPRLGINKGRRPWATTNQKHTHRLEANSSPRLTYIYIRYENNTRERYACKTFLNTHTQIYSCTKILKKGQPPTNQPTQGRGCNRGCRLHPHWCPCSLLIFMLLFIVFLLLFMLFFIPIFMLILTPQGWCAI